MALVPPQPWVFRQAAYPYKTLTLDGGDAPHGRPRKGPMVKHGVTLDSQRTSYGNGQYSRHVFGFTYKPWHAEGRLRDRGNGSGHAYQKMQEIQLFAQDGKQVFITWGQIFSCTGFIKDVDFGPESPAEITYELVIDIDSDDLFQVSSNVIAKPQELVKAVDLVKLLLNAIQAKFPPMGASTDLVGLAEQVLTFPGEIAQDFAQAVQDQLSLMNRVSSVMQKLSSQAAELQTITFRTATRFIGALDSARDAVGQMLRTMGQWEDRGALLVETVDNKVQGYLVITQIEDLLRQADEQILAAQDKARKAAGGYISLVAIAGDTWEALSTRAYGTPDFGDEIRDLNDAPAGSAPSAGATYLAAKKKPGS